MKKIGLALGGGGAKGLAHIPMLEVFDELDLQPHCIAGTSIGAIMGALYTSDIKPDIHDVEILEFYKANDIYEQAKPARQELKHELEKLL